MIKVILPRIAYEPRPAFVTDLSPCERYECDLCDNMPIDSLSECSAFRRWVAELDYNQLHIGSNLKINKCARFDPCDYRDMGCEGRTGEEPCDRELLNRRITRRR